MSGPAQELDQPARLQFWRKDPESERVTHISIAPLLRKRQTLSWDV